MGRSVATEPFASTTPLYYKHYFIITAAYSGGFFLAGARCLRHMSHANTYI